MSGWEVEVIPDSGTLFLRVHKVHVREDDSIAAGAFADHGGGMSVDWAKYATPHDTRSHPTKGPGNYGAVSMNAGHVRSIDALKVIHEPIKDHPTLPDNRAHSEVIGDKTNEVRMKLGRIVDWAIRLGDPIRASYR